MSEAYPSDLLVQYKLEALQLAATEGRISFDVAEVVGEMLSAGYHENDIAEHLGEMPPESSEQDGGSGL